MPRRLDSVDAAVRESARRARGPRRFRDGVHSTQVKPVCMGFEDFYAGWSPETPPGFSVSPIQGRMERRGGEPSLFDIEVKADGQTGEKVGYLCIVLPDDDEQFTIKVTVNCF